MKSFNYSKIEIIGLLVCVCNLSKLSWSMMDGYLSPKTLADALGTSESSVRRWCDAGKMAAIRTAGGHRRIARAEAM